MYKQDLALNNQQGLVYRKTQPTNQPTNLTVCKQIMFNRITNVEWQYLKSFKCVQLKLLV